MGGECLVVTNYDEYVTVKGIYKIQKLSMLCVSADESLRVSATNFESRVSLN